MRVSAKEIAPDFPPTNQAEFLERFATNHRIVNDRLSGGNFIQHMPCPFCAAPDWLVFKTIEIEAQFGQTCQCRECGRSVKIVRRRRRGVACFDYVQTGGDDPPDWMVSKMRRV